ncbi:hypothetical protein MUO83_02420 [Candidatus Bathyarchaeota archaeon]|nr:hypothetical protein [Candidatus Bathyarchaeota archaeon]
MRTIKVSDEVHKKLGEVGKKAERFSDIVQRLLAEHEERQKLKKGAP